MAIARLSVKVGKAGKAAHHAAYVARTGRYASRLEKCERLVASEVGNMPVWAQGDPLSFWEAADAFERKNGSVYREMEIALPRELDAEQQIALVRDWVQQEIGDKHAYQWAIHAPKAADGKEQPHVHLMFSERQRDGIERDPEQYFKRYNAKAPERGGCKKGWGEHAGQTLKKSERVEELQALRERWQVVCNRALERAGQDARIDMRSYKDQGLDIQPEKKMLPSEWRQESRRAEIIDFRQARAELAESRKDLARLIPDMGAEIIELQEERKRRAERQVPDPIQDLLGEAEALLNTGKTAKAAKQPRQMPDALQEIINADQRAGRRGVSASRQEPARAPEKAAAPVIPPKATEPSPTVPAPKQAPPPAPAQETKKVGSPNWLLDIRKREQQERERREREARDRTTEQETRPGIRHPEKPRWQAERERQLTEIYSADLAEKLGRWVRVYRHSEDGFVHLSNARVDLVDRGDRVVARKGGTDEEIAALVEIAKAKGWERTHLTGSAQFQQRAAQAFVAAGLKLDDPVLEQRARQALEAEREATRERVLREQQERETRPGIRHADRSQWAADRDWVLSRKYDPAYTARAADRGFYSRWMDNEQGLFYERKKDGVLFVNQGPLIVMPQGEQYREGAPELYVLYARARGWKAIDILGPEPFRLAAARVALEEGLMVSDLDLARRARQSLEAERPAAITKTPKTQERPKVVQRPAPTKSKGAELE